MLSCRGISFSYPGKALFRAVDLDVLPGNLLHLRGPNGAGKSTFLRICAGLLDAQSGEIDCPPERLDYLPAEANGFHLKLGAAGNLDFWHELRTGKKISDAVLQKTLAEWKLDHPLILGSAAFGSAGNWGLGVGKFSTGMKRRLALARLVLNGAPLWLLDEPVSGLDEDAVGTFVATLDRHLAGGGGAIIISHDTRIFATLQSQTLDLGGGTP